MIKATGKLTKVVYLVLGFVGGEDGPARAVCIEPGGGRAYTIQLVDLEFDAVPEPVDPQLIQGSFTPKKPWKKI